MARSHGGFGSTRTRGLRRLTAWGQGPGGTGVSGITSGVSQFLGASVTGTQEGLTVIRIRGFCQLFLSTAGNVTDGFTGALGIGIATLAAVTAGIASVPTPLTEEDSENWLWHQYFGVHTAVVDTPEAASSITFEIDSKAMRKFPTEMAIYAAIEVIEQGAATLNVTLNSRLLAKLP